MNQKKLWGGKKLIPRSSIYLPIPHVNSSFAANCLLFRLGFCFSFFVFYLVLFFTCNESFHDIKKSCTFLIHASHHPSCFKQRENQAMICTNKALHTPKETEDKTEARSCSSNSFSKNSLRSQHLERP